MSSAITLDGPGRYMLRLQLRLTASQVCRPGKIMWWSGAKFLGANDIDKPLHIPRGADGAMLNVADYARIYGDAR
jgi:hypothetical protein